MPKKGEKIIRFNIKLSESKNKYVIVGDKEPKHMFLPVVIDSKDLEQILNQISEHFFNMRVEISPDDIGKGILKIELKNKE